MQMKCICASGKFTCTLLWCVCYWARAVAVVGMAMEQKQQCLYGTKAAVFMSWTPPEARCQTRKVRLLTCSCVSAQSDKSWPGLLGSKDIQCLRWLTPASLIVSLSLCGIYIVIICIGLTWSLRLYSYMLLESCIDCLTDKDGETEGVCFLNYR